MAVNQFHLRRGRVVDRRGLFSALLKQLYLDGRYIPALIHVPLDFEDREALEEVLTERRGRAVEIHTPQRGPKKALLDLVETNARHSFDQRFRVLRPTSKQMQEALREALSLEQAPRRIEYFDVSHTQGTEKVASMVVWEDGGRQRRFRVDARSGRPPLHPA